jgi:hypothetical protein
MSKSDLKYALKNGVRAALLRWCRARYREVGGPADIRSVKGMVSVLSGQRMSQVSAWKWLLDNQLNAAEIKSLGKATKAKATARKPTKAFYSSEQWRAIRFEALKAGNGCCCLCGRSNREHGVILHVDHIKPRSKFPELALTLSNLQVMCEDCNLGKSNRDDTDWRTATALDRSLDAIDWRQM